MVKSGSESVSDINAAHLPESAYSKKKDGGIGVFGMYARSFRSLRGRSTGVEENDMPKFVTHRKGARNKKTNSNKDNSRALIDDDASDSDDNEGLFGFPGVEPLIDNIGLSNSGINKIQANYDDEVNGWFSKIYGNTSLLPELDESFE